ncbi:thiolase C-terminal domain-containing protein [Pontivivens nitratireducens]|uniref:thiolase C-terminal domain-containing protein n=1 Tax=Pontivivens nitratireducens TaxID=2758038 RepID=UPI0016395B75
MGENVVLLGGAATPVGKMQGIASDGTQQLEHEVLAKLVVEALEDAGLRKCDVGSMIFTLPRPYTQQKYFATFMANYMRLPCEGLVMEVLGNGMTPALTLQTAIDQVRLGRTKVALALGINFETGTSAPEHMMSSMRATGDVDFHVPFGFTPIAWYAMDAVRYMHEYNVTREEIAMVAVKNRRHAADNPIAQFRKPMTLDDVLAQRPIVEPLGLFEVPGRGDGAVCIVVASEDVARESGKPFVRVKGEGFYHEGAHQISEVPNDMIAFEAANIAGAKAYSNAGITPGDVDLAEIYAPCTIVEILAAEALGLCSRGQGAGQAASGETALGGRIPICTSGGLLSRGHPAYVTALYNYFELMEQLRGRAGARQVRNAELGLACTELGNYNAAMVHILEAVA